MRKRHGLTGVPLVKANAARVQKARQRRQEALRAQFGALSDREVQIALVSEWQGRRNGYCLRQRAKLKDSEAA